MDLTASLQRLAAYRPQKTKTSQETFDKNLVLLKNESYKRLGDEGWEAIEKLALAALDQDKLDVADQCLQVLSDKFPNSPRVECLTGIRMEATESPETALQYYDELLKEDSSNAAAWRRKAGVLRRMDKIEQAVSELCALLDTFYTEVEGWLELADIYASCQQYTHALQALSHALLLAPQNPFHFLQFAEIAYLAKDIPLAIKMFLVTVDMTDDDEGDVPPGDSIPTGLTLRAWFGVKLCTSRLIAEPRLASVSESETPAPKAEKLSTLDALSTERLRTAYLNGKGENPPQDEKGLIAALAGIVE